jgi:tetratricopeptide (TPR) repeat protein
MARSPFTESSIHNTTAAFQHFLEGQDAEAEQLYLDVLQELSTNGEGDFELANAYHGLGQLYSMQGKYEKAEPYLRNALRLFLNVKPVDAFSAGTCYCQLGAILQVRGSLVEAERAFQRGVALCEEALGHEHPLLPAVCLDAYCGLLTARERESQAHSLSKRIRRIKKEATTSTLPHRNY